MKKLILAALLAAAGIYGVGYVSLSESGIKRFLDNQQEWLMNGQADAFCDSLTDDMRFKIKDHTAKIVPGGKVDQSGGRQEMCDQFRKMATSMTAIGPSLQLERRNLKVERTWLHPWTAHASLTEYSTLTIGGRLTIKTESDDRYVFVRTLSGVKIKSLESEAFLQGE